MQTFIDSFEKIPCLIYEDKKKASVALAEHIAGKINEKRKRNEHFVLGLATGASPLPLYKELIYLYEQQKLSFENVIAFNLDEYYPIQKEDDASYHHFLFHHLFKHIDIKKEHIHLHSGNVPKEDLKQYCIDYEKKIRDVGGIDFQILGVGHNGHIGFNEPGSSVFSKTRLINLSESSRSANSIYFANPQDVPRLAITMGISTIMQSKEIALMAWGESKSSIIKSSTEGESSERIPASLLQQHDNTTFYLDKDAASQLTRYKRPWLTGSIEWTEENIKKAVVNMAIQIEKPILSLSREDYVQHGLMDMFVDTGESYYDINLKVFHMLRNTITGWPGGKPGDTNPKHPERPLPQPKRVLIFSPHPDDDIISMGGTMQRLHDHGHEVHVGYQTSGNVAVSDTFVIRSINLINGFEETFKIDAPTTKNILLEAKKFLKEKQRNQVDSAEVRTIKGLIRKYEAIATCNYVGLDDSRAHFMNLPFYETGKIEKGKVTQIDLDITKKLLREIKPHQVYVAGDLADPHGTHKTCLHIIFDSIKQIQNEGDEWVKDCWVWMYKGAWQEWDIDQIEMAVPMSPEQVLSKRHGIFLHQSQKDDVPFQGEDKREFWERAEERNANTAKLYSLIGLPKYAAIEGFVRWTL